MEQPNLLQTPRARKTGVCARSILFALGLLILLTGCGRGMNVTNNSVSVSEAIVTDILPDPKAIAESNDGVIAIAGIGVKSAATAKGLDRDGRILWNYSAAGDPSVHATTSAFYGAVGLANGNFLFCGATNQYTPNESSLVVILDAKGGRVKTLTNSAPPSVGSGIAYYFCFRTKEGVLLLGGARGSSSAVTRLVTLDDSGEQLTEHLSSENNPMSEAFASPDGSVTFSGYDGNAFLCVITRLERDGQVLATRSIKAYGSLMLQPSRPISQTYIITYGVGNAATLHILNERLEDAAPARAIGDFDARESPAFVNSDGTLVLFGRTSKAAVAVLKPADVALHPQTLNDSELSFGVAAAVALSKSAFLSVRNAQRTEEPIAINVLTRLNIN